MKEGSPSKYRADDVLREIRRRIDDPENLFTEGLVWIAGKVLPGDFIVFMYVDGEGDLIGRRFDLTEVATWGSGRSDTCEMAGHVIDHIAEFPGDSFQRIRAEWARDGWAHVERTTGTLPDPAVVWWVDLEAEDLRDAVVVESMAFEADEPDPLDDLPWVYFGSYEPLEKGSILPRETPSS